METRAGTQGIVSENLTPPDGADQKSKLSFSHGSVPLLRKHQIMQQRAFKQFIVFRSEPVIEADLISYRQVLPWRNQAEGSHDDDLPVLFSLNKAKWR